MLESYMAYAGEFINDLFESAEKEEKRILKEWNESKNLPRKAKKRKRKELNFDFGLINFIRNYNG